DRAAAEHLASGNAARAVVQGLERRREGEQGNRRGAWRVHGLRRRVLDTDRRPAIPAMFDTPSDAQDDLTRRARELAAAGEWTEVVRLLAPPPSSAAWGSELQLLRAEALNRVGDARAARGWLEDVMPALVARGDRTSHRRALNLLGAACFFLGALDAASEAFSAALEMASRDEDLLILARATNNLGMIANLRGQHETALGHYRLAVPTYQRLGQRRGLAESYHNIAITYRDIGALDEADEYEPRAIDYAAEVAPR